MSVIDGAPEVVFQILMSLGSSRSEWDFCFEKGSVIESIDGHTDIIHKILNNDWLPWGMKRRDLLLQRYWNREDDGTYCGGYVISPVDQSKHSVVRHMLDVDWKLWRSYLQKYSDQSLSIHMIGRLAALREFFKTNIGNYISEFSLQESKQKDFLHQSNENKDSKVDVESEVSKGTSVRMGFVETDYESDEFFDPPESFLEDLHSGIYSQKTVWGDGILCDYKFTLPEDQTGSLSNSWSVPEPSLFQIRGETYFEDHKKITAQSVLMQTVAVDWLRSDKREDNLAARPGNIVQKFAADGRPEFFLVVNFQVPGSTTYTVASYYMTRTPIKDLPLLEQFVEGDDAFRNSRFKIVPHVTEGPWVLRKSVHRATLVGQLLKINYIRGKNYIELDIDVGSSALARGVASTALSCFNSIICETAFVIQANTPDELPEHLFGATRLNYVDVSKAFQANPVVRLGINPMIQPEPEDLPKDNPKLEIAVLRMKMEILLESASNKLLVDDAQEIPDEFYRGAHFLFRIASTIEGGWNLH
ncbi:enhanced disease resistance 2-like protein [Tanacetum coccineum]